MPTKIIHLIGSLSLICILTLVCRPCLAQTAEEILTRPGGLVALAKHSAEQGKQLEQAHDFVGALAKYESVISLAESAINQAERRGEARTVGMHLILGSGHLDAGRMQNQLDDPRKATSRFAQAEEALSEALRLDDKMREENRKLPIQKRQLVSLRPDVIAALGEVNLHRGDLTEARINYQSALRLDPPSQRAQTRLAYIDLLEKRIPVAEAKSRGAHVSAWLADFLKSDSGKTLVKGTVVMIWKQLGGQYPFLFAAFSGYIVEQMYKKYSVAK